MANIRRLYFSRLNHEYKICQLMYYTSRQIFNLATFDFCLDQDMTELKDLLMLIAGFVLEKGDLIRTNITYSVTKSENIFLI